jgi:hypothetical protein
MPNSVVLEGTLNTLLWFAARNACRIIFPAEDPECMEGRERIDRIQRALSHALVTVMAEERAGVVGRVARLRSEQRETRLDARRVASARRTGVWLVPHGCRRSALSTAA